MSTKSIDDLRNDIDETDAQILKFLNRRAKIAIEIGKLKSKMKTHFHFPDRERKLMDRLCSLNKGPFKPNMVRAVYQEIVSATLSLERPLKISYLGPSGTFTHIASIKRFGASTETISTKSIDDVFNDAEKGRVEYGVVPVENSIEGMVSRTLDLLMETKLNICDEIFLPVHHHLLSKCKNVRDVKKIYSHYQPFAQCRSWLEAHKGDAVKVDASSTARAAQLAAEEEGAAAIASDYAATLYGLNILAERIEDIDDNTTRFLVIGEREREPTGKDKTSILVSVKDQPGALKNVLDLFSKADINLTKIESRPVKKKVWKYMFFIDLDGHHLDSKVNGVLKMISDNVSFLKILGSYPRGE